MSQKNKNYDAYSLADLFREMELELIASASRTLAKHEAWEKEERFKWEQWQLAKLRSLQQYQVNNRKIIKSYKNEMRSIINDVIKSTYSESYQESLKIAQEVEDVLDIDIGSAVDLLEDYELPEENFFHINDVKVDAIIQEMSITFDSSESLIMRKMNDNYRATLEKSVLKLGAGVTDVKKAIDEATNEFLNKGIDCITYKNGRRVNIVSYAEMYLRTANQQATFYAQGKARDLIGVYTVLMSQHENCSPMCLPYQGTVMIDDVFTALSHDDAVQMARETGYTRLATAIENHAFHPNCRHSLSTWYPGKSSTPKPFTEEQNEAAVNRYNLEQEQRRLENNLRKWRRVEAGSVDKENKDIATQMIKKSRQELRNHVKENPNLRRNYWRERTEPMLGLRQEELVKKYLPPLPYENVTQEWLDAIDHSKAGKVIELDYFEKDGVRYDSNNATLKFDHDESERNMASLLADTFHEDVNLVPRTAPGGKTMIATPDYFFKEQKWDLKTPKMNSANTIRDLIRKAKKKDGSIQANNFIIDISKIEDLQENIERKIDRLFEYENTDFVDEIIIVKNNKIIKIKKKKR